MKTYTKTEIRKMVSGVVLSAMALCNAYAYRAEMTKIASDICSQRLSSDKNVYTKEETDDIINDVDTAVYAVID